MKAVLWMLLIAAVSWAGNAVSAPAGPVVNTHPVPPAHDELYWDDGILSSGWAWYTGGNYWAVQFDETKTGGDWGNINYVGAVTYPNWPDSTFQGGYIHIFDDLGGYPGSSVGSVWMLFTSASTYNWRTADIYNTTGTFYVAFRQYGNYPSCDSMGVDAAAGTHDWTGYQGSWGASTSYGDFMLRCYWQMDVESTTWGQVKSLY